MAVFAHHFKLGFVVIPLLVVRPCRGAAGDTQWVAHLRMRERKGEGAAKGSEPGGDKRERVQGLCEQVEWRPVGGSQVKPAALVTLSSVTLNFELKKVVLSSCLARLLLVPVHFIESEH